MPIVQPFRVEVEPGLTLRGSVHLPDGETKPVGAVVLFHGFTGQRMENGRLFVDLAKRLAAQGYAVLSYDRFGHGESDGDFFDMAVSRDIDQVPVVVKEFLKVSGADPTNLHFVGFSLGAVVAASAAGAAAKGDLPVTSLTLWSPASHWADRVREGYILDRPVSELYQQGYLDVGGQRLGPALVADGQSFDSYGSARPFQGRALMMHGTKDFVPPSCSKQYAKVYGSRATLDLVAGADHSWDTVPLRERLYTSTIKNITGSDG